MLFISSLLSCLPQDDTAATPLIIACGLIHIEVARFLVEHGADTNLQNKVHVLDISLLSLFHIILYSFTEW